MKLNVVIISPMLREFHCAREAFGAKEVSGQSFRIASASLKHMDIKIINSGRSLDDIIPFVESHFGTPDLLIDSGTAGGLSESVSIGDIILGESFKYDGSTPINTVELYSASIDGVVPGTVLTVEGAVESADDKAAIAGGADICTMETYYLASAAEGWGCRFLSLRIVTDLADENTSVNFRKNARPFCLRLYGILKQMLMNISN